MERRHSTAGMVSLGLALFAIAATLLVIVGAGVYTTRNSAPAPAEAPPGPGPESPVLAAVGFSVCGLLGTNVLGVILGVFGLFQRDRKPLFAVLGATLNALAILAVSLLLFLGTVGK